MPAAVVIVIAVVSAVASSFIMDKINGTSKNLKKQERLAKEREAIAERQRQMQLSRDKALATKATRAKMAAATNAQAAQGALLSSSYVGGQAAIASNLRGAIEFADATGALAAQDSAIKMEQIELQTKMKMPNHLAAGAQAGLGAISSNAGGLTSLFSSTPSSTPQATPQMPGYPDSGDSMGL
jgi:hypothetical protein